ncbi:MAG: MBL fold metallo-hydrolase [Chitinispirillaceae bacterium]
MLILSTMDTTHRQVITISVGIVKAFLIRGKGNILVDTGIAGTERKVLNEIRNAGVRIEDISLVVLTHVHSDHTGGLYEIKKRTGARVAVHKSEAGFLKQGRSADIKPSSFLGRIVFPFLRNSSFRSVKPDIEIDEELSLDEFGIEGTVIHTPGHTDGSVSVMLSTGEAIIGDLFSGKGMKRKAGRPMFATSMEKLKTTLDKIMEHDPQVIYTSHGGICSVEAVRKLRAQIG